MAKRKVESIKTHQQTCKTWTDEEIHLLLDEYAKYPFLKSTMGLNRKFREETITNIGKLFGTDYNGIFSKMRQLRHRQRQVENEIKTKEERGEEVTIKWPFYEKLSAIYNSGPVKGINYCRKWTKDETFDLLSEIIKHPKLMPNYPYSVPRTIKRKISNQIGEKFNTTGAEVEKKFKKLRDFYGERNRTMIKRIESGQNPDSLVIWPFFDIMREICNKYLQEEEITEDKHIKITKQTESPTEEFEMVEEVSADVFEKPKDQSRLSPNFLSQVENAISMTKLKDDEYGPFIRFITLQLHKMDEEQVELFKELSINDVAEMQVLAGSVVEEEVDEETFLIEEL